MINENKIPLTFCRLLEKIRKKEKISISKFSSKQNKNILNNFVSENILQISQQSRAKYVYCRNTEYLDSYLQGLGIKNLKAHIVFLEKQETTRAEATKNTSNSKYKKGRIFNGFFVKTYKSLYGEIENEKISLKPQNGTWIYIQNYKNFTIDKNITVVGIENSETFTFIENYKHLFTKIEPLFLLRYNNNSYIEWLQNIENNYLHFGDFDLSAMAIYITEFRNKLDEKRCNFYIPEDIETLIKQSTNRKDYIKQLNDKRVKNLDFNSYPEISELARLIQQNKKTIEQEILMK